MLDLTQLEAEVARDEAVNTSAATLIGRLAEELEAAKDDPVRIQALADRLRSSQDALAAAVAANTPAEQPATPPAEDAVANAGLTVQGLPLYKPPYGTLTAYRCLA